MNCGKATELLTEYLDGLLPPGLSRELSEHLRSCSECKKLLKEMQGTVHLLQAMPIQRAPASFAAAVNQRIATPAVPVTVAARVQAMVHAHVLPALATGLTVLLALLIGIWSLVPNSKHEVPANDQAYLQAVMADHDAYAAQQPLADGSGEVVQSGLDSPNFQ